ncbi:MAG: 3,5-cyclic-AMP phosphodiesterase [Candidatus Sumerlaeota bacterium]|nr:3,5-cyclic-AMP phosphodiesterase [Candidatus Sumerlaeota bacterium]
MSDGMNRRDLLKVSGGALLATSLGCQTAPKAASEKHGKRRALRVAHLTDMHLDVGRNAEQWGIRCFQHVQSQADPPDLILNGGDIVMDALDAKKEHVAPQWDVVQRVLRTCSLPIVHCLGNHDVWGWNRASSGASPDDPHFGKKWAQEVLSLEQRYYSRDLGSWKLLVLDSNSPGRQRIYDAHLDEEQFAWLKAELAATPADKHVMILSHIPILCAAAYFDGENEKTGDWIVPGSWMHQDARALKDLFFQHPNVRLALSGHIHLLDRIDYNGVTYLCNGAVCGSWWKGSYQETPPGYAMIDLYEDGTFDHEYVTYGWKKT